VKAGTPLDQAKGILAATPKSNSLAARRAEEDNPAGVPSGAAPGGAEASKAGWNKQAEKYNQRFK
jgi:hypothetical protein